MPRKDYRNWAKKKKRYFFLHFLLTSNCSQTGDFISMVWLIFIFTVSPKRKPKRNLKQKEPLSSKDYSIHLELLKNLWFKFYPNTSRSSYTWSFHSLGPHIHDRVHWVYAGRGPNTLFNSRKYYKSWMFSFYSLAKCLNDCLITFETLLSTSS